MQTPILTAIFLAGALLSATSANAESPELVTAKADALKIAQFTAPGRTITSGTIVPTLTAKTGAAVQVTRRSPAIAHSRVAALDFDHASGVSRHQLDGYTRVTGWRIGDSWYFGKQKGNEGGLALVWQGDREQMSVSTEGVRLTRRF